MGSREFMVKAVGLVRYYAMSTGASRLCADDFGVYVVWSCKTLQNNKALLSTDIPDSRYYEVTYNGDKDEFYLDAYVKEENRCIKGEEIR